MTTLEEYEKGLTRTTDKIQKYRRSIIESLSGQKGSVINGELVDVVKNAMELMGTLGSSKRFYEMEIKRLKDGK